MRQLAFMKSLLCLALRHAVVPAVVMTMVLFAGPRAHAGFKLDLQRVTLFGEPDIAFFGGDASYSGDKLSITADA